MATLKKKRVLIRRRNRPSYVDAVAGGTMAIEKVKAALQGSGIRIVNFGLHDAGWLWKGKADVRLCVELDITLDNPPLSDTE